MKMQCDEKIMLGILQSFLCLDDKSSFHFATIGEKFSLKFSGNIYNVREKLLDWLLLPERLAQTKSLSDEEWSMKQLKGSRVVLQNKTQVTILTDPYLIESHIFEWQTHYHYAVLVERDNGRIKELQLVEILNAEVL